jgi:hypothetical protein
VYRVRDLNSEHNGRCVLKELLNPKGVGLPLTIKTITYMRYLARGDEFGVLRSWRWADLYAKR